MPLASCSAAKSPTAFCHLACHCPLCPMSHGSSRDSVSLRFQLRVSVLPYPLETLTSTAAVCASSDTSHTIPSFLFPRILQPDVLVLPSNAWWRKPSICESRQPLPSPDERYYKRDRILTRDILGWHQEKGDLRLLWPDACRLQQLKKLYDTVTQTH